MALETGAAEQRQAKFRTTLVVGCANAGRSHNTVAQRAGPGRYPAVLSLRDKGRRIGCQGVAGGATGPAAPACRFGRRYAGSGARSCVAHVRLPLPAVELAAGVQD